MIKRLDKLRSTNHPEYLKLMSKLGSKDKNKKMTVSQKDMLRVALETESVTRDKELAFTDGYLLMSETDYYVYMHGRTGWGRKKSA